MRIYIIALARTAAMKLSLNSFSWSRFDYLYFYTSFARTF